MKIACGAWSMHSLEKDRIGGPQAIVWRGDVAPAASAALVELMRGATAAH